MGVLERKEREKEIRRQQILDAGEKLFVLQGFNVTTMEHISNECEISRGTIYLYFKNKEEIFQTIMVKVTEILYNMMKDNMIDGAEPNENLRNIGEAYLAFYRKYPSYYKLLNIMEDFKSDNFKSGSLSSKLLEMNDKIWGLIVNNIEEGVRLGILKKNINPYEFCIILWASSSGIINVMDHFEKHHTDNNMVELIESGSMGKFGEMCKLNLEDVLRSLWNMVMNSLTIR